MEKHVGMKVRWIGETDFLVLTHGKIYTVLSIEKDWYRVIDDSGEDYLYPPQLPLLPISQTHNTLFSYLSI